LLDAKVKRKEVANVYRKIAPTYDLWGRLTESHVSQLTFPSEVVYAETLPL